MARRSIWNNGIGLIVLLHILSTMQSVFGDLNRDKESENIISLESLVRANYEEINENYLKIKEFRHSYDFGSLISNAKSRLQSFLGCDSLDTSVKWKPVYFLFLSADGKDMDDALVIDFNLIYKMTEEQRINFLAHEFFHVYRGHFENHEFNYANDINFAIDMIAQYADKQIDKNTCIDKLLEIYKYNGHALGFYMSNQIILAGLKQEMLKSFYNPYEFYRLYFLSANKNNDELLSRKFLSYLKQITEQYYQ